MKKKKKIVTWRQNLLKVLHIDPWLSHQSEIFFWTGCTCVNKQKLSHGWLEIMGVMKWYMQMPTWGCQSEPACSGVKSVDRELWLQGSKWHHGEDLLSMSCQKRRRKALKITQRDMVKISLFVGWLVGFYGISTFSGYLTPNPFLCE